MPQASADAQPSASPFRVCSRSTSLGRDAHTTRVRGCVLRSIGGRGRRRRRLLQQRGDSSGRVFRARRGREREGHRGRQRLAGRECRDCRRPRVDGTTDDGERRVRERLQQRARGGLGPVRALSQPRRTDRCRRSGALVSVLASDAGIGLVAPRVLAEDGSLEYSQRRLPARSLDLSPRRSFSLDSCPGRPGPTSASATRGRTPRAATASGFRAPACSSGGARSRRSAGGTRASSSMARTSTSAAALGGRVSRPLRALGAPRRTSAGRRLHGAARLPFLARGRIRYAHESICGPARPCSHQTGIALGALTHAVLHDAGARCQGRARSER